MSDTVQTSLPATTPIPNPHLPTSSSQCVITSTACPSNATALSQASPHGTNQTLVHPVPYFVEKHLGGRDTNAGVSTLHCSPGKRDVNRGGANFPGFLAWTRLVGQRRRGPPSTERSAISPLPSSLSTSVGSFPISTSNLSLSSHTRIHSLDAEQTPLQSV